MNDDGLVIVACDPLDGSSNIDTNLSIGTIFSRCLAAAGPPSRAAISLPQASSSMARKPLCY